MNYIEKIAMEKASKIKNNVKIIFPEGNDARVIETVKMIAENNLPITPVLIGNKDEIEKNVDMNFVEVISDNNLEDQELIDLLLEKRKGKLELEDAKKLIQGANYYSTLMVESGRAQGMVGGCIYSTADILRPAFQVIGPKAGYKTVSSSFVMLKEEEILFMADCAVNIDPSVEQLSDIAKATVATAKFLGVNERNVAMLSFSTKGSGKHEWVDKMAEATKLAQSEITDANVDGELQFDAAYVESVGKQKAPESNVAGKANIFVFPNLESGNIGYKIAQRLGNYEAVGPVLQGLAKPIADLSRGAGAYDIYLTTLLVFLQIESE